MASSSLSRVAPRWDLSTSGHRSETVSPSKELRDAFSDAEGKFKAYTTERSMRLDVHHGGQCKMSAWKNIQDSGYQLGSRDWWTGCI
ncbi:hypothetical protein NEOLEDRAFT_1136467 [Neolentinus lepideus HHB14362 ss-1]|uniref:Uncharacterized protein n=1 Tax=Neolentinus lepideus HHB14362 ss-1 TaxID=1314782 RepID=A0A165R7L4_9AGAM|nr:hypothetical protein NEOLEDRAFT_1136467 [Neolentinus lepideus HHB14362 ss-1]